MFVGGTEEKFGSEGELKAKRRNKEIIFVLA